MAGTLEILNVGAGDVVISFDKSNSVEAIRAKRIIRDMLKRGYALLVKLEDGSYTRATAFDANTGEYIIADFDPEEDEPAPAAEPQAKRKGRTKRVKMDAATVTAVGRSAGG